MESSRQTGRVILTLCRPGGGGVRHLPAPGAAVHRTCRGGEKTSLRPGIDMAGGTSLLYQIREPVGGYRSSTGHTLAEDEVTALKQRVDPNGIKNSDLAAAGDQPAGDPDPGQPAERPGRFHPPGLCGGDAGSWTRLTCRTRPCGPRLSSRRGRPARPSSTRWPAGSTIRKQLFAQLAAKYDAVQAARAARDADAQAVASDDYDRLAALIDATNLRPSQVGERAGRPAGDAGPGAGRPGQASPPPTRRGRRAVSGFVDGGRRVQRRPGEGGRRGPAEAGAAGVGRAGVPHRGRAEQRADRGRAGARMARQLHEKGPRAQAGDQLAWFQVDRPDQFHGATEPFNGKEYILCWITPRAVGGERPGRAAVVDGVGRAAVGRRWAGMMVRFQFDPVGGNLFHDFTANNVNRPLAAILDRKVVSVANIHHGHRPGRHDYWRRDQRVLRRRADLPGRHAQRRQPAGPTGARADQRADGRPAAGAGQPAQGALRLRVRAGDRRPSSWSGTTTWPAWWRRWPC